MSVYSKENHEYLDMAIKSILIDQSIIPDDFVMVADGPLTNEIEGVISKYLSDFSNFNLFRLNENQGLGKALNYGLQQCKNEIVFRADSDDVCTYNRFRHQLDYLSKNPDVDILGGTIEEFIEYPDSPINRKVMPLKHKDVVKLSKFRNPLNHMTVVFKKSKIQSIGSYLDLPYLEDYYLWIRAIQNGLILNNVTETMVLARIGNGMIIRRSNRKYVKSWKVLNKYMKTYHMINAITYSRNIIAIVVFIYTPKWFKKFLYEKILRKSK